MSRREVLTLYRTILKVPTHRSLLHSASTVVSSSSTASPLVRRVRCRKPGRCPATTIGLLSAQQRRPLALVSRPMSRLTLSRVFCVLLRWLCWSVMVVVMRVLCCRSYVMSKAREEFQRARSLSDAAAVSEAMTVGYTQLDNLEAQVAHMRSMIEQGALVHRGGMVEWRKDEEAARRLEERQRREKEERKRRMQEIRRLQKIQQQQQQASNAQQQPQPQSQPTAAQPAHRSAEDASG